MERNAWFYRFFFIFIACLMATVYEFSIDGSIAPLLTIITGILKGFAIFALVLIAEIGLKRLNLRSFNTALFGLAAGALMGFTIALTIKTAFALLPLQASLEIQNSILLIAFLASVYVGIMVTSTSAESWWLQYSFCAISTCNTNQ